MGKRSIVIRCDGGVSIGMGHIIRCIALAEILQSYFDILFLIQQTTDTVKRVIGNAGFVCTEIPRTQDYETESTYIHEYIRPDSLVVLDGYNFQSGYQLAIKGSGHTVIAIDDLNAWEHHVHAIFNHAPRISVKDYKAQSYTRFYLGSEYALLRREILAAAKQVRTIRDAQTFLISMGAADINNYSMLFARLVTRIFPNIHLHIMASTLNPHLAALTLFAGGNPDRVFIHLDLSTQEVSKLLSEMDVVICPASNIALEACAFGCTLITGYSAENQKGILNGLIQSQAAFSIGKFEDLIIERLEVQFKKWLNDKELRAEQARLQRTLIDGNSGHRIALAFMEIDMNATCRRANLDDMLMYFEWANDPDVRANSYQTSAILLTDHKKWFQLALQSSSQLLYVYSISEIPFGQIRLKKESDKVLINYSIDCDHRGKGLGKWMLSHAALNVRIHHSEIKILEGWVKKNNVASLKAFEAAGYIVSENGEDSVLFRLTL